MHYHNVVSKYTAYRYYNSLRKGIESMQDLPRSDRPTNINFYELKQAIETDPTLSTRDVANMVGCSQYTVRYHFNKLRLHSTIGRWAPISLPRNRKKREFRHVDNC